MSAERSSGTGAQNSWSLTYWIEGLTEEQYAYLMLVPAFALVGAFAIWPLAETLIMSLHADSLAGRGYVGEFVGFENYVELLTGGLDAVLGAPFFSVQNPVQNALVITLIYALVSVFLELLIGFGQALILDQSFRGRRWLRVAVLLPWAVPIAIQGMIFYLMFLPDVGFATGILQSLGVFTSTPFINTFDSLFIVILADVWKTSAFIALIVLAGLQSIDRSLYQVAKVAGASRWQQFRYITLPMVFPALIVALLFRTIQAMRVFGIVETVSSCSTIPTLSCLVVGAFQSGRFATAAAVAFATALVVGLVAAVYVVQYADIGGGS